MRCSSLWLLLGVLPGAPSVGSGKLVAIITRLSSLAEVLNNGTEL